MSSHFIHVVVNGRISVFFKTSLYSIVGIHIFLIHLPTSYHLGCFHIVAIVISAAMNMRVKISLQDPTFNSESFPYDMSHSWMHDLKWTLSIT